MTTGDVGRPQHARLVRVRASRSPRAGASGCRCSTGAAASATTGRSPARSCPGSSSTTTCKETPAVCAQGREVAPERDLPRGRVAASSAATTSSSRSSSLQYARGLARRCSGGSPAAAERYLYVARVPVALHAPVVRRPPAPVRLRVRDGVPRLGAEPRRAARLRGRAASRLAREFLLDAPVLGRRRAGSSGGAPELPVQSVDERVDLRRPLPLPGAVREPLPARPPDPLQGLGPRRRVVAASTR